VRAQPVIPPPLGSPGADLWALADDLLDRLAERVADRVLTGLGGPSEQDDWLDLTRAAEHLDVHPDTLRKRAKSGLVPFEQDGPRCRMYFRRAALDEWRHAGGASVQRSRMAERASTRTDRFR
jgi:hypothetical protein